MSKVFRYITNNDHQNLSLLLESNPELVNSTTGFKSTITKSIEFRSKECFDILINHPNLKLLNYVDTTYPNVWKSGMAPALNYYGNAPNNENLYYLQNLLNKNVTINHLVLEWALGYIDKMGIIFNQMFDKCALTIGDIKFLFWHLLSRDKKGTKLIKFYHLVITKYPNIFTTGEPFNKPIQQLILDCVLKCSHFSFLYYMLSQNIDVTKLYYIDQEVNLLDYIIVHYWDENTYGKYIDTCIDIKNKFNINFPPIKPFIKTSDFYIMDCVDLTNQLTKLVTNGFQFENLTDDIIELYDSYTINIDTAEDTIEAYLNFIIKNKFYDQNPLVEINNQIINLKSVNKNKHSYLKVLYSILNKYQIVTPENIVKRLKLNK
jgi:hypothetical protein